MEWFKQVWDQISQLLRWWVIVLPWEQGVKIWLGKKHTILLPGIYFRIPYLHSVYIQPIRACYFSIAPQTLTTLDGKTLTIGMIIGYSISDIYKAYNSVAEVKSAVAGFVAGRISAFVSSENLAQCNLETIEAWVQTQFKTTGWGITIEDVKITTFALVRTYRMINDGHWMDTDHKLDKKI